MDSNSRIKYLRKTFLKIEDELDEVYEVVGFKHFCDEKLFGEVEIKTLDVLFKVVEIKNLLRKKPKRIEEIA